MNSDIEKGDRMNKKLIKLRQFKNLSQVIVHEIKFNQSILNLLKIIKDNFAITFKLKQ